MKVFLRLFAGLREAAGCRELELELPEGARVSDLKARFGADFPAVGPMLRNVVFAVDDEYIPAEERLHEGARVSAIPPVSGGETPPLFWLTEERLEPRQAELAQMVGRPECGAVVIFYGVVRNNLDKREVLRLEYEAHESMAVKKMAEVADEVRKRFPAVAEMGIWHRTGLLEIGEASLLVALSSPHREEGFEACHWAVDRIKQVVPVWKKEHFADGGAEWVAGYTVDVPQGAVPGDY
jgi:molybdopterin synthase catalytic subunit/molybdopterin converting factor small subunit